MNIIYFGNGHFAIEPLKSLLDSKHKISCIVTNEDKRKGRGLNTMQTPVATFCSNRNLRLIKINNLNDDDFIQSIRLLNPDLFVVVEYKILPKNIYNIPKYYSINIHASLLPKYRGAAPIQRSIMNGDKTFGLTSFVIDNKIDNGKIIHSQSFNFDQSQTYGDIYTGLSEKSQKFILVTIDKIKSQNKFKSQCNVNSSLAPKIKKNEFKINLTLDVITVYNKIRALTPPGPYLILNKKRVKIFNISYDTKNVLDIGEHKLIDDNICIGCKTGSLFIKEFQFEGKKRISYKDFSNNKLLAKHKFE